MEKLEYMHDHTYIRSYSLLLATADWPEGEGSGDEKEQEKQVHTAPVRSLQEEHSRQQEELLQVRSSSYRNHLSKMKLCKLSAHPSIHGEGG